MEFEGLDALESIGKQKMYGEKSSKYLTIASIDIETNDLQTTGYILSFGYNIGKFYCSDKKPTEKATDVAAGKYICGYEPVVEDELYFYYDGLQSVGRSDIHGITMEMLIPHKDKFNDNLAKMAAICTSYITLAKNGWKFDLPFIVNFLLKNNIVIDADNVNLIDEQDIVSPTWKVDTNAPGRKSGTLSEHVEWLNSKSNNPEKFTFKAHRALDDTLATSWCYYCFMKGLY